MVATCGQDARMLCHFAALSIAVLVECPAAAKLKMTAWKSVWKCLLPCLKFACLMEFKLSHASSISMNKDMSTGMVVDANANSPINAWTKCHCCQFLSTSRFFACGCSHQRKSNLQQKSQVSHRKFLAHASAPNDDVAWFHKSNFQQELAKMQ